MLKLFSMTLLKFKPVFKKKKKKLRNLKENWQGKSRFQTKRKIIKTKILLSCRRKLNT